MTRVFEILTVACPCVSRRKSGQRVRQIVVLSCVCLLVTGCKIPEKNKPIWEQVKIGDIAPSVGNKQASPQFLKTINFDVHTFEIPAENIDKLDDIWKTLYIQPLRFRDYKAFRANSFVVRFGQTLMLNNMLDLLRNADGQKIVTIKLLIADGQASNVVVAELNTKREILYISSGGLTDKTTVGPGILFLRIRAGKTAGSRDMCNVIAEPAFSLPIRSPIPDLSKLAQRHEFIFAPVAFGLKMSPGDFVLLGPDRYISDQNTLSGLFFNKPRSSFFFSETELKPAIRIFILVCSVISD